MENLRKFVPKQERNDVPEKVKRRYAIMVLASELQWMFQALQLANRYGFQNLEYKIVCGIRP